MSKIVKVVRCLNKGAAAEIVVRLDDGSESTVWVGGEVIEVFHAGKSKSYVIPPWARPKQSRKGLTKLNESGKIKE